MTERRIAQQTQHTQHTQHSEHASQPIGVAAYGGTDVAGPVDVGASLEALRERAAARLQQIAPPALVAEVQAGTRRVAFCFAGQGADPLDELVELLAAGGRVRLVLEAIDAALADEIELLDVTDRARLPSGLALLRWLAEPARAPAATERQRAAVSAPLIFAAQLARAEQLLSLGLEPILSCDGERAPIVVGHSQGLLGALALSASAGTFNLAKRLDVIGRLARAALRLGCAMEDHDVGTAPAEIAARSRAQTGDAPTPMAAIAGVRADELRALIDASGADATFAIENSLFHHTVSGAPTALEQLRTFLMETARAQAEAKKQGRVAGRVLDPKFSWLPVSGPFHSRHLTRAADRLTHDLARRGLSLASAALTLDVLDARGAPLPNDGSALERSIRSILVEQGSFRATLLSLTNQAIDTVIDVGPGVDVAHLSESALRGRGVAVVAAVDARERARLLAPDVTPVLPAPFARYAPRAVRLAAENCAQLENAFTRLTGRPPVILPGMTPTTVEAPIVVAAANAGYVAELAGGGQVTEAMLRARMDEIARDLAPGQGIVFNALYLDPYLWGLHLAKDRLVFKLRAEGYPIIGVTVSAGIPPLEDAVALFDALESAGMMLNALKPGNDRQLAEVIAIARARPHSPLFVHIEGGKAGGHHSWEDLDDLLLRHYAALRAQANLVLCVGGGIGTEEQATAYLTGAWSERFGAVRMPVDAVFLGTRLMATREACTSHGVKQALVSASGDPVRWPLGDHAVGGVASGRSSLDAPIWTLDNAAARAGRLLDEVAGDTPRARARKDEIAAALAGTAKPYFGDVDVMAPAAVLARMTELMAIGSGAAHEDGLWLDASWRTRFVDMARRVEARFLCGEGASMVSEAASREPQALLAALVKRVPDLAHARMHPEDARFFLELCRRPGKPVPFVPVIDADVRRWFKSDSLWQSHHERFSADAVFAIPGPAALAAVRTVDEPVAHVLDGFVAHALADTSRTDVSLLDHAPAVRGRAGILELALAAPEVRDEHNRVHPNPLACLFPDGDAAVTRRRDNDGALVEVTLRDARSRPLAVAAVVNGRLDARIVIPGGPELDLQLSYAPDRRGGFLRFERERFLAEQQPFYARAIFDADLQVPTLFEPCEEAVVLSAERLRAFYAATHDDAPLGTRAPLAVAFSLAWPAIFRALAGARPDVLHLVHESDVVEGDVEGGCEGEGLLLGDELIARARVTRVETVAGGGGRSGRRIHTSADLLRANGQLAARVTSQFWIRESVAAVQSSTRERRSLRATFELDDGSLAFLRTVPGVTLDAAVAAPCRLVLEGMSVDGVADARLCVDDRERGSLHAATEVVATLVGMLAPPALAPLPPGAPSTLGSAIGRAPADMGAYALASGDRNPLHTHLGIARLAGFGAPIVHGMWTAAFAAHRIARQVGGGDGARVQRLEVKFLAPVPLGAGVRIALEAKGRTLVGPAGALDLGGVVEVEGGAVVAEVRARVAAPRSAYVFPGQGVQHTSMGMETYGRSAAARAVWDEADAVCRTRHGFSLLHVVKDNPRELWVRGERLLHPDGVLFLTQFTQVALAVMAVADVAELRERGALVEGARFAGHSLGEYSALAAVPRVMRLSAVVDIVYHRGLTMDRLVARDAQGRSQYAMGAVRPNLAGLGESEMIALIEETAARTGEPLFVVNHNVRGRQYAVTGTHNALGALEAALAARQSAGADTGASAKPAYVDVPGIDVPFHSPLLRDGVEAFRATLEAALPARVDATLLEHRFVPNLTGTVFALERRFLSEVWDASGSPLVKTMIERFEDVATDRDALARALLVEVLAYQFASPVRWIQVQDALLGGPDAVEVLVEVGPARGPVLTGMAKATLSGARERRPAPRVLHAAADAALVSGAASFEEASWPAVVPAPQAATTPPPMASPAARAATAPSASVSPASRQGAAVLPEPAPFATDALRTLLCLVAKKARAEVDMSRSLDALLGGNSARRNQVLAEVAAEFGGRAVDNAHEIALQDLALTIHNTSGPTTAGAVLRPLREQAVHKLLSAGGLDVARLDAHLDQGWALPPAHRERVLNRVALAARATAPATAPATDRTSALALVDGIVEAYGAELGVHIARSGSATTSTTVDSAALEALEARVFGVDGVLARAVAVLQSEMNPDALPGTPVAAPVPPAEDTEHDDAYRAAVRALFDEKKHVAFTSAWAWLRRDVNNPHADAARVQRRTGSALQLRGKTALVTGAGEGSIARALLARLLTEGARVIVTTTRTGGEAIKGFKRLYQQHAALGAELHVVPANQGSFGDVDALAEWIAQPRKERVGSHDRVLKAPWLPDLLIPFGAIGETADLSSMGPRSLAMFRVLVLGVERLVARMAELHRAHGGPGSRVHVLLPLSPNHGTFGGDGAYGECKAALEALMHKQRSEGASWGRYASIVGARIGWVRGTGLMHENDAAAVELEQRGLKTFSTDEMADALLPLVLDDARARAASAPFVEDLTGGLNAVTNLAEMLGELRVAEESRRRVERRCRALTDAFLRAHPSKPRVDAPRLASLPRQRLAPSVPTGADLARLPALDHLDLDEVVVIVGAGEVSPWGSARTRWAIECGAALSIEAVLELAWMMGLIKPDEKGSGFLDAATGERVPEHDAVARYEAQVLGHAGVRIIEPACTGFDPRALPRLVEVRLERDFSFAAPSREVAEAIVREDPAHTALVENSGALRVVRRRGSVIQVPAALSVQRHVAGQIPSGWDATRLGVPKQIAEQVDPVTLYCLVSTAEAFLAAGLSPEELYAHLHPGRVGVTIGTGIGGMSKLKQLHRDFFEGKERQNDTLQETLINVIGGYVVQTFLGSYGPMSFPVGACATAGLSVADAVEKIKTGAADLVVAGGADDLSEAGLLGFGDMGATADTDELAARGVEPKHMSRPNDRRRRGFVESQGAGVSVVCRASLAVKLGLPVYGVVAFAGSSGDGLQTSVPAPGQGALALAAERRASAFDDGACDLTGRRAQIVAVHAQRGVLAASLGAEAAEAIVTDAKRRLGHTFYVGRTDISPLRGALAVLGLGANDVGVVSKHDSSTYANDLNEAKLHESLMSALGRSDDRPLWVVSQKALTGHPKGAAAAWQMNGLMQAMADGVVPGNASLDDVDDEMQQFPHLVWSDEPVQVPWHALKAGFVTTLGFGHVSALVCLAHPYLFWRMLDDDTRAAYAERLRTRMRDAEQRLQRVLSGREPLVRVRPPHLLAADERALLLDAEARMPGARA